MFVVGNVFTALATVLDTALSLYFWIVLISALLSWVNPDPSNRIVRILRGLTEPVFYRIRRLLPFTMVGGIDFSPVVLLLGIQFVKIAVVQSLYRMAMMVQ